MYENCKIYGPYLNKKDGRLRSRIKFPDGSIKTISYPKYLMEVHLGRYLEENETIDHIDGNLLNNNINNLLILDRKVHCENDATRNKDITVNCEYCGKEFTIEGDKLSYRNRRFSGYFCSKSCSGNYGRDIQLGRIKPSTVDKVVPDKYKRKSAQGENPDVEAG